MKLKFVFLFVVLAYVRGEEVEECKLINVDFCHVDLLILNLGDHTQEERCRVLWKTLQCVDEVVDECAKKNGVLELNGLEEFREDIEKNCPRSDLVDAKQDVENKDDETEEEEEVEDEEEEVEECKLINVDLCHVDLFILNLGNHTQEERCKVLRETLQCVEEVVDECAKKNGELELEGLEEFREDIEKKCPRSDLVDAKQDVENKDDETEEEEEVEDEEDEEVEECKLINVDLCHVDLFILNLGNHTQEERCKVLRETLQCVEEVVDECAKKNGDLELEGLEEFRKDIKKKCPRSRSDDANQDVDEEEEEEEGNLEECKNEVNFCHGIQEVLNYRDHTEEEGCRVLRNTLKCFDHVKYMCHQNNEEYGLEDLEEFRTNVENKCPLSPIAQCRKILNNDLLDCIDIAGDETMEKIEQIHGSLPENFIQCSMWDSLKSCTANRVKVKCGELASQINVIDMLSHHADMIRNCERGF